MKLKIFAMITLSTCFGLAAIANSGKFRQLDSVDKYEVRGSNFSQVLGIKRDFQPTFVTSFEGLVEAKTKCQYMVEKLQAAFIPESFPFKEVFYDYAFVCIPAGEEALVIVQFNIEAQSAEHHSAVEDYLKEVDGITIFDHQFNFQKVKAVKVLKEIQAHHITNWDDNEEDFSQSIGEKFFKAVSFGHYLEFKEIERAAFQNPVAENFFKYLANQYGDEVFQQFKSDALVRSNYVDSSNQLTFVFEDDTEQVNKWREGWFRICSRYTDGEFCAKE